MVWGKSAVVILKEIVIVPGELPIFATSVKLELNAVGLIELWPVDRTPGVSHVLVVADMEDPTCHTESDDNTNVLE